MGRWGEVEAAAPELAAAVRDRFEATGLALLATLRQDGAPRLSGIEPWFADGELWLGMMHRSRKALDLLRDPRCALHAATVDKDVTDGDVKVAGRAVEVDEPTARAALTAYGEQAGHPAPEGPAHVFRLELDEVVRITPAGDHLVIQVWTPTDGLRSIDRY